MNDELKTKEYLKSLESLRLSDSSRLRIREELLAYARFHAAKEMSAPVKSPFSWLLLKPVQAAFAIVLVLGAGAAMYLGGTTPVTAPLATTETPTTEEAAPAPETTAPDPNEGDKLAVVPAPATKPSSSNSNTATIDSSARSMALKESADVMGDEVVMTTMLSQGEMNIEDYRADIVLREKTYRALIDAHETEIGSDTVTELIAKLDTVVTLLKDAEGKQEAEARPLLDKAIALTGEIESTLSLLGTTTIENGVITDIEFTTNVPE